MLLYKTTEQKLINNTILIRTFEFYKSEVSDKKFYINFEVKDLFDFTFIQKQYPITYSSKHQKFLEQGIKKGKRTPLELFSTEEEPLYEDLWNFNY